MPRPHGDQGKNLLQPAEMWRHCFCHRGDAKFVREPASSLAGEGAKFASSVGSGLFFRPWRIAMTIWFPVFISVLKFFYRFFSDSRLKWVRISRYKVHHNE